MPDLNLLVALDVLLAEGSVAKAARRLRLIDVAHELAAGEAAGREEVTLLLGCQAKAPRALVISLRA